MIQLKSLIAALFMGLAALGAQAQAWKEKYPELVYANVNAAQGDQLNDRFSDLLSYLSNEIGVPVKMRNFPNYTALIEAHRNGEVHFASFGASSYATARTTGVRTTPFAVVTTVADGSTGYYSVFYVKSNSPYMAIEDLKGKSIGLVDPQSQSGNIAPRFVLNKLNIKPEDFFNKITYAGSHDKAVLALNNGEVDVIANSWTNENASVLNRMARSGLVNKDDFRIILKSDMLVNGPFAYLDSLPEDLKLKITQSWLDAPTKGKTVWDKLFRGQSLQAVNHEAYLPVIELNTFVESLKK